MKRILLLFSVLLSVTTFAQKVKMEHVPGEVLLQLKDNVNIGKVEQLLQVIDGKPTGVEVVTLLSKPMNIWRLKFDTQLVDDEKFLRECYRLEMVRIAQFNHYVQNRATVPNDPSFGSQWQWVNNGGGGGTADADIDADEAWDITTGGLTAFGDSIVVCVLEGGGSTYNHPDLIDNHWRNYGEIPGDGIDNDGNGYIDDYNGWNTTGANDVIGAGSHGTSVSGMIGARGNNGVGVTGINWNVKIMQVDMGSIGSGSSPNEAEVIAAYTYPLVMRKLYNQSNGSMGAFVVATNASWGIDYGDPANAPLWCAFYDTLGVYGILNCGATTNSALDVDVEGDLPTACPSPYMISVTATDNQDVRTFSGYGQTTIDVAAPGASIYITSGTSSYSSTSGTSFATPLTAGVIALMYSVNCPSFMALVKADPQAGADYIRNALFASVDPKANLTTETVTGGRVNAFNSVTYVLNNCATGSCIDPLNLNSYGITLNEAYLNWLAISDSFMVKIREVGAPVWDSSFSLNDTLYIDTLQGCTWYEYQVANICDGDTGAYSNVYSFKTDGCCDAPMGIQVAEQKITADVSWNPVTAASEYLLFFAQTGTGSYTLIQNATSPYTLPVDSCTDYEYFVATICATDTTYSDTLTFKSKGCGACFDFNYCSNPGGVTTWEWIQSVQMGAFVNSSGSNNGYVDFTGVLTPPVFNAGSTYPVTLTPGFAGTAYTEYFKVWIDINHNGIFESSELMYDQGSASSSAATGSITIPAGTETGITKMRVVMKYVSASWDPSAPEACTDFDDGEVEDYCVEIVPAGSVGVDVNTVSVPVVYPNPASNRIFVNGIEAGAKASLYSSHGSLVNQYTLNNRNEISLEHLALGLYILNIQHQGKIWHFPVVKQ
jgi:hypothetical protein